MIGNQYEIGFINNKLLVYDKMDINGYQTTNFIFNVKGP